MKQAQDFSKLAREKFPDATDYDKIQKALDFATTKHSGQKRLSGEDYIIHPIAVASILINWDMDRDTVIAGLLHDVAEDTPTDLKVVEEQFGKECRQRIDNQPATHGVKDGGKHDKDEANQPASPRHASQPVRKQQDAEVRKIQNDNGPQQEHHGPYDKGREQYR